MGMTSKKFYKLWYIKFFILSIYGESQVLQVGSHISYFEISNIPYLELKAQGQIHRLLVDTGSSSVLELPREILEKYSKPTKEVKKFQDVTGKIVEASIWTLSNINIFGSDFDDLKVNEVVDFGLSIADESTKMPETTSSVIGSSAFTDKKVILDFKQNHIKFCEDFSNVSSRIIWRDLKVSREGLEITINVNGQNITAVIDTGASVSFCKEQSLRQNWRTKPTNEKHEQDAGVKGYLVLDSCDEFLKPSSEVSWNIFVYDFTPNVDMILGMDVLRGKILLLDFVNFKWAIVV